MICFTASTKAAHQGLGRAVQLVPLQTLRCSQLSMVCSEGSHGPQPGTGRRGWTRGALPQPRAAAPARAADLPARWNTEEVLLPAGWGFMTAAALPSCAQAESVRPRAPTARPCTDEFTHQRRICLPPLPLQHPAPFQPPACSFQRGAQPSAEAFPWSPLLSSHVLYPMSRLVAFISRSRKVLASSARAAGDRKGFKGMWLTSTSAAGPGYCRLSGIFFLLLCLSGSFLQCPDLVRPWSPPYPSPSVQSLL